MAVPFLNWTIRDLEVMPDDGGWKRYEIINGELLVTRSPHIRHQDAAAELCSQLRSWSKQTGLGRAFQSPGIILSPQDAVIPDVIWISQDRLTTSTDQAGHITVSPELMIEILSPGEDNQRRDREAKLKLYSIYGVQEYWIVSWQQQTVEIYRRTQAQLQLVATLFPQDPLSSPLLPGFSLDVGQIFA